MNLSFSTTLSFFKTLTTWDGSQNTPIVIAFNLCGKCSGFWRRAHEKIVLR